MLFEAMIGCGSLDPCRRRADFLLACRPGHRRPCGEWLKRGLHCRKLMCLPALRLDRVRKGGVGGNPNPARLRYLRTRNRWTWAFAVLASVGAFGVYLLLAASISLVALARARRIWKCCGINYGISWTAHSIRNSSTIAVDLPARTLQVTVSKKHGARECSSTCLHRLLCITTPLARLVEAGLRGSAVAVNARPGADAAAHLKVTSPAHRK
jgi:hypothetical protein